MVTLIIIWGTLSLPLLLGILFRVGAPHLFFSVMAGELLGRYFGHDVEKLAADSISQQPPERYGEVALIIIPILLTAFFMRKTESSAKIVLHILPLAITGIILAAFLFPVLPTEIQTNIDATFVGGWILNLNKSIIGVVVVLQLIALWLFDRKEKKKKRKHRKEYS